MKTKINTLLLLFSCYFILAQNPSERKLFTSFDKIIGIENTTLSYGALYKEKYRSLKGNHHYFEQNEFKNADIFYNNEPFFSVKLKFDITDDLIITQYTEEGKKFNIALESSLVSKFNIDNHSFINTTKYGFVEVLYKTKTTFLLKKHKKIKYKKLDKNYVYYNFKEDYSYILKYNGDYFNLEKIKNLYTAFPNKKQKFKDFKKQHSFLLKHNKDAFYIQLIKSLNTNPK